MFCLSYTKQAKIIAIIEIVTTILGCGFVTIPTVILSFSPELRSKILEGDPNNVFNILLHFSLPEKVTSVLIPIIYFIGEFLLAVLLYKSVIDRNYQRIRIWYIATITICMTAIYCFLPGVFFTDDSLYFIGIFVGSYAFTAYSVYVVHSLMNEMKRNGLHVPIYTTYDEDMEKL